MTRTRWPRLRQVSVVVAGALAAVVGVDAALGALFYKKDTEAGVYVNGPRTEPAERVVVLFPGYLMPGRYVAQAFAPHFADSDVLVSVDYAERGVDVGQIYAKVMEAIAPLAPSQLAVYGSSMGGMVASDFLRRYEQAGAPLGKITLILDTAPSFRGDVKRPGWLLDLACWYRGGPLSSAAWAMFTPFSGRPPAESGADSGLIRASHDSGAWVGLPAVSSQACYIGRFSIDEDAPALERVVEKAYYLHGTKENDDPLIDTTSAVEGWRRVFPAVEEILVAGRSGDWHIPLVDRPRETTTAILSALD